MPAEFSYIYRNASFTMNTSDTTYHRLFDSANAAILIISADFEFIDCNEMAAKLLDRPKKEILGWTPTDPGLTPEYQANGRSSLEAGRENFSAARQGKDLRFEWTHLKKDGTPFPVEVSLFGFIASNKEYYFAMWRDLSEVEQKERELKESEERFRSLFTQSADGILILQKGKGFIDCNQAALNMLKFKTKKALIGKNPWEISPEFQPDGSRSRDSSTKEVQKCYRDGQSRFEWLHENSKGEPLWFDIVLTKITINNEDYLHCLWRDISKRKQFQSELEKYQLQLEELVKERTRELEEAMISLKNAQSQLVQSEKMASLGIMTSGIAHEINNPLNYILGSYTGLKEILGEKDIQNEQIDILLDALNSGIDRASNIIKGITQLSGNKERMDEACPIHDILDNCLMMLEYQMDDHIEIGKSYLDEALETRGSLGGLHQVFINIFSNAIQSMDQKGKITVTTKKVGELMVIEVQDTGCGIKQEHLPRIIDPFFTTKDPGKGTGLGLSIAYSIVNEHRGNLEFESIPKQGTLVRVSLPLI